MPHASGRPWLLGTWAPGQLTVARTGTTVVAVIGTSPITASRLAGLAARVRRVEDVDGVLRAAPGSAHVLVSAAGVVRAQGTVSALRQVFHTRVGGQIMAADRADVLARMSGAGVDEDMLATRVVCRGMALPPPLAQRPLWRGVHAVAPDHYLRIDPDGTSARPVRRWSPPDPGLSLAEGALRLRQALSEAVAARRPDRGRWGSDLSGGLDSTTLSFLAARTRPADDGAGLVTYRWGEAEAGNDDAIFASSAAAALPHAQHVVTPQHELPALFTDPQHPGDLESPYPFARTLARIAHTAAILAGHGVRTHLAGHGGDELFHETPAYVHDLLRTDRCQALRHLRGFRALGRWPWPATLAALADPCGLDAWWRAQADQLTQPAPSPYAPAPLSWGPPLRAPAWATPAAIATARAVLRDTAEHAHPLARRRGQHATLAILGTSGPAYRQLARVFAAAGVRLEMPYFDDTVIDITLAVRPEQRRMPWRYRPLQAESMRGIVPPEITGRSTKGEFGQDVRDGLAANTAAILEVFTDSALATAGLIDPARLRDRLLAPHADNTTVIALEDLLGCETWLRTTTPTTVTPRGARLRHGNR
ncbi:asparagine synthase-related protein [Amycolatopsis sp. QT-25]|uniref:asparagine synthase-related protein n=1 Tax=Amycolatopsis sp. QT-25 TaxID=3034022 RepID=UPI0023ECA699|nr:asparagine synthase-related protein [Amycolatopsis sp. QT-25]WET76767.1 asparagine synthase-related protein [Amycolatopsis sp. QT-25]